MRRPPLRRRRPATRTGLLGSVSGYPDRRVNVLPDPLREPRYGERGQQLAE